jgi:basic membrane protein A
VKSWRGPIVATVIAAVLLMGVATGGASSTTRVNAGGGNDIGTVGLALPGPKNDQSFNQGNYEGVKRAAKKFGFEFKTQENVPVDEAVTSLRNLASVSSVVIAAGGQFTEAVNTVAPDFPDVRFIVVAGEGDGKNITSVFKNYAEQSYIMGVLAATITKAKKVGFVGGLEIPPVQQASAGFEAGVKATDPSVEIVSTNTGSFTDAAKAKEAASAQIDSGADVINSFVDAAAPGIIEAVDDSGEDVVILYGAVEGVQCKNSKAVVATSPVQQQSQILQAMSAYDKGKLGPVVAVDLASSSAKDKAGAIVLCPGQKTPELKTLVKDQLAGILDKSIEVPTQ